MPLTKGHECMIELAASQLDELYIIVSSTQEQDFSSKLSLHVRYEIIKKKYAGRNITVIKCVDAIGPPKCADMYGTASEEHFWKYWVDIFRITCPDATHFVSSDRYGAQAAKRLNIEWFAVDPERDLMDITATQVRADPIKHWKYISREFRPHYVKRVVVVGPESAGKSTLVKDLGKAWGSPAVPEYGRTMTTIVTSPDNKNYSNTWHISDFHKILDRQQAMNTFAAMESDNGFIFIDSDALTTWLYAAEYLNAYSNILKKAYQQEKFDLVVLVKPDIPWVDDGTRTMSDSVKRQRFFNLLLEHHVIAEHIILEATDRNERVDEVLTKITEVLMPEKLKNYDAVFSDLTKQDASLTLNTEDG